MTSRVKRLKSVINSTRRRLPARSHEGVQCATARLLRACSLGCFSVPSAARPTTFPPIDTALPPFFCLSTNCHGNGRSPILLGSLCKWHLCLTVTGFKIILRARRQVIKLNFQPVDHMNVANEWWIKRAVGGGVISPPPPHTPCKNTAHTACSASYFSFFFFQGWEMRL